MLTVRLIDSHSAKVLVSLVGLLAGCLRLGLSPLDGAASDPVDGDMYEDGASDGDAVHDAALDGDVERDGDAPDADDSPTEVCDNGIDDDSNGATDCDDAACARFTGCPQCVAQGTGRCYYVDAVDGDDGNDGSFESPWRTYLNFVTWSDTGDPDPRTVPTTLEAGDVVYFRTGTYSATFRQGILERAIYLDSPTGEPGAPIVLAGYPGESPIFETPTTAVMWVESANWVEVRDIEIAGALDTGVFFRGASNVTIDSVTVHGVSHYSGHSSGIDINTSRDVVLSNLDIYDIGTPANLAYGLAVFLSVVEVRDSRVRFAEPRTSGACVNLVYDGSRVLRNTFEGCQGGVRVSGDDIVVTGNLIRGGNVEVIGDMTNIQVSFNTLIDGRLYVAPRFAGSAPSGVQFRWNVVLDRVSTSFDAETSLIAIAPNISGEWQSAFEAGTAFESDENCIHSERASETFSFYDTVEDFSAWQGRGFDTHSNTSPPGLDADGIATSPACSRYGFDNAP